MSVAAPSRRLAGRCLFCQNLPLRPRVQHQQQRTAVFGRGKSENATTTEAEPSKNPVLDEYHRKNPSAPSAQPQERPVPGDLAASSIFEDDRRAQRQQEEYAAAADGGDAGNTKVGGKARDPNNMLRVLDPDPNSRERWERKKVIQMVRRGGRLTDQQVIKRTEREHLVKSQNFKTSVKKLGMLARQIQGKTIEDAIVQMRFSKKKIAQDILKQLEYARDEAVVMRGMGLGGVDSAAEENLNDTSPTVSGVEPMIPGRAEGKEAPLQIQLKSGKRHTVADPSKIYIDQAWVGRGPYGQLPDFRARGNTNIMRTPWTSLTVLLKEEVTRIREYEEREEKRRKSKVGKNLWVPLPDRPVQWQRQWYTF
ncbi:hypothetical protein KC363_g1951 [Hortaea werneckii]|uniref:Ribosomal protein L22 n=1 Tax=Hortaea werneckii TaxID=91943 RepID=A0A3M7FUE9_HORWE|nr:hypothetical protein KC361_g2638 [Hortaea werneckii]KAI6885533.1 hypothetical protein KC325_g3467 [Hortaea werneckii]KAI6996279.1 hypothetical protein KC359_g3572 [Hortaea werneckii]KAI7146585.1 hypothetical protein KC344_g3518 [Hortaea werneckii]KAI7176812.1 hypothetical protein KC360_g2763 [Hortaea werneckii]